MVAFRDVDFNYSEDDFRFRGEVFDGEVIAFNGFRVGRDLFVGCER